MLWLMESATSVLLAPTVLEQALALPAQPATIALTAQVTVFLAQPVPAAAVAILVISQMASVLSAMLAKAGKIGPVITVTSAPGVRVSLNVCLALLVLEAKPVLSVSPLLAIAPNACQVVLSHLVPALLALPLPGVLEPAHASLALLAAVVHSVSNATELMAPAPNVLLAMACPLALPVQLVEQARSLSEQQVASLAMLDQVAMLALPAPPLPVLAQSAMLAMVFPQENAFLVPLEPSAMEVLELALTVARRPEIASGAMLRMVHALNAPLDMESVLVLALLALLVLIAMVPLNAWSVHLAPSVLLEQYAYHVLLVLEVVLAPAVLQLLAFAQDAMLVVASPVTHAPPVAPGISAQDLCPALCALQCLERLVA